MSHCLRAALATSFALAASLFAQQPATGPVPDASTLAMLRVPIHGHVGGEAGDGDYGLWAAGAGYKASFAGGMRFLPVVASGAPSIAFAWRTTSARIGETELVTRTEPELRHEEWRAEYDHGSIVEAYDVRLDGLEQTFVLARRPAASGDLVIRGAVTTALQPSPTAAHAAVLWRDGAGRPCVSYGAAVAIDALGRRCAMTTTTHAGELELRLAGDWLAGATFPLVVDPLLAPVAVSTGAEVTAVAMAHDHAGSSRLWFAEVRRTGTDDDLRLYRADSDGTNPVLVFTDLSDNWSAVEPTLARNLPATKVALAYTREIFATATKRVRGHVHARADVVFQSAVFDVPNPGGENHWRPSLGEELSPVSFTSLPLVFQVEPSGAFANGNFSQIWAVDVLCGGTGSSTNYFAVAASAFVDQERPSVGQCSEGPTRKFTVAYQRYAYSGANGFEWDIALRRIGPGVAVSAESLLDTSAPDRHEMAPRIAGRDDRLMVVYTASTLAESANKPLGANGHRIRGTRLEWNGTTLEVPHGSRDLQVNGDARLELAGLAFDSHTGSHWAMAFRSNVTDAIYFRTYGFQGLELVSETVHTPAVGLGTSVLGSVVFQSADDEFLIGYGANEPGLGNYARVRRWQHPALGTPFVSGSSCTSTTIDWWGRQRIGTESCGVVFTNAPANALTLCLVATASASLQLFGIGGVADGCWLLVPLSGPDHLGILPASALSAMQWHLPLPEGLPNMTLRFQAVSLDPADGLLHSSARLTVPIGL